MQRILICSCCFMLVFLQSCKRVTQQVFSEVVSGPFKVVARTQEISYSGSRNVDVCVMNTSSRDFPDNKAQCFLNGYDFDGLSVSWTGARVIEVSFSSGRVSQFSNSASVDPGNGRPEEFHTLLCDGCGATPTKEK